MLIIPIRQIVVVINVCGNLKYRDEAKSDSSVVSNVSLAGMLSLLYSTLYYRLLGVSDWLAYIHFFFGLEGSWGQPQGPNFPSP